MPVGTTAGGLFGRWGPPRRAARQPRLQLLAVLLAPAACLIDEDTSAPNSPTSAGEALNRCPHFPPAAIPGLLLIIVGVTVVVTSGVAEQATARPYPDAGIQDPGVDWARYSVDESPTVTLTCHGAGSFDTLLLHMPLMPLMPRTEEEKPNLDGPAESCADRGLRR